MHGNGRPISNKKLARVCIALTLLVWATQVLFKQWGFGAELPANTPVETDQPMQRPEPGERFMEPRANAAMAGVTLQLRADATVNGAEVRLKQIARWSNRDSAFFQPVADLVLVRLNAAGPYRVVDLDEVKKTLADAGVNMAQVKFAGAMNCAINRADTRPESEAALAKWIDAKEKGTVPISAPVSPTPAAVPTKVDVVEKGSVRSLRDILTEDLAIRVGLPIEQLQIAFNPKDDRLLNLSEPQFKFNIQAQQVRNLGEVIWAVTLVAEEATQKAMITANARAWQNQVTVNHPIAVGSVIRADDVVEHRVLIERMPDEPVLSLAQSVGQQASRDLRTGTLLTSRMVESVQLVRTGQLVSVTLNQGSVHMRNTMRSLDTGTLGQRIRVKNETTNDLFDVVITGPQEASFSDNR